MVNVGPDCSGVDPNLLSCFDLLLNTVANDLPVKHLPCLLREAFDALLENRFAGILSHIQTGKRAEDRRVFQVKIKTLIAEMTILFQNVTPKNRLGIHAFSSGIMMIGLDQILVDEFCQFRTGVKDHRNMFQFFRNSIV